MKPKAVILLSGGLDSTTVFHMNKEQYDLHPLTINYSQRHSVETFYAEKTSKKYLNRNTITYHLPLFPWADNISLINRSLKVPNNPLELIGKDSFLPSTFVPGRNSLFLSLAFSYAYCIEANFVFVGFNVLDYSGYPDCRPNYLEEISIALSSGVDRKIVIFAPLIKSTKQQIKDIADGLYDWKKETWSCYDPQPDFNAVFGAISCGVCDSCKLRGDIK